MKITNINKDCGIYLITHRASGRRYVGASKQISKRIKDHISSSKWKLSPLYDDIRKWGIGWFSFETLEICEKSSLPERELFYIRKFDSINSGYNRAEITNITHDLSELHKLKISKSLIGHQISKETRDACSAALLGKNWTPEKRENVMAGIAAKGRRIRLDWFCSGCQKNHGGRTAPQKTPDGQLYCKPKFLKLNGIKRIKKNPPLGERNPAAVLTEKTVLEILNKYTPIHGMVTKLANEYGLKRTTVSMMIRGKTWSHISGITKDNLCTPNPKK